MNIKKLFNTPFSNFNIAPHARVLSKYYFRRYLSGQGRKNFMVKLALLISPAVASFQRS